MGVKMIKFQAKYLPALMRFKATKDIRYYLNGVHATPHKDGGAVLVATNGHIMMAIRDTEAICTEDTIFRVDTGLDRFCKKQGAFVTVNEVTQRLAISSPEEELFIQAGKCIVEGKFPDWRRVLPKFSELKAAVSDLVRGDYLVSAVSAHPGNGNKRFNDNKAVRLWQVAPNSAVIVEYVGVPEMCGVVMPVRDHSAHPDILNIWAQKFGQMEIPEV